MPSISCYNRKKKYVTTYLILYLKEDLGGLKAIFFFKCPILSQYDLFLYNKFQLYIQVV